MTHINDYPDHLLMTIGGSLTKAWRFSLGVQDWVQIGPALAEETADLTNHYTNRIIEHREHIFALVAGSIYRYNTGGDTWDLQQALSIPDNQMGIHKIRSASNGIELMVVGASGSTPAAFVSSDGSTWTAITTPPGDWSNNSGRAFVYKNRWYGATGDPDAAVVSFDRETGRWQKHFASANLDTDVNTARIASSRPTAFAVIDNTFYAIGWQSTGVEDPRCVGFQWDETLEDFKSFYDFFIPFSSGGTEPWLTYQQGNDFDEGDATLFSTIMAWGESFVTSPLQRLFVVVWGLRSIPGTGERWGSVKAQLAPDDDPITSFTITDLTTELVGAGLPAVSGVNWHSWNLFADTDTGPETPSAHLYSSFSRVSGFASKVQISEFYLRQQQFRISQPLGLQVAMSESPHGGGDRIWQDGKLNVEILTAEVFSAGVTKITFITYNGDTSPTKKMTFYFDVQEDITEPGQICTLTGTPGKESGPAAIPTRSGNRLDGITADGITIYAILWENGIDGVPDGGPGIIKASITTRLAPRIYLEAVGNSLALAPVATGII